MRIMDDLKALAGCTPLAEITCRYKNAVRKVYAKLEFYNFSGSIKDRMAFYVLSEAVKAGKLPETAVIVEATSGNTGIAFAAFGAALGRKVHIFMPEWMSFERKAILRGYGAEITYVTAEQGAFEGAARLAREFAARTPDSFLPLQFENPNNPLAHYHHLGREIVAQMDALGLEPQIFTAGVGTGGTVMGVGRRLREHFPRVLVYPLEPANCPAMAHPVESGVRHRIEGIGDGFVPPIIKKSELLPVTLINDCDAICMAQKFSRELGLGVGISSGANFLGALKNQDAHGGLTSVTVFADDNKKYLSTDLMKDISLMEDSFSSEVELLDLKAYPCGGSLR